MVVSTRYSNRLSQWIAAWRLGQWLGIKSEPNVMLLAMKVDGKEEKTGTDSARWKCVRTDFFHAARLKIRCAFSTTLVRFFSNGNPCFWQRISMGMDLF